MNKKILFVGIMAFVLLFMTIGDIFAQQKVADLGDVRIYKINGERGRFYIESDRLQQTIPLRFYERAGVIEVVCSSYVQRVVLPVATSQLSYVVEYVVTSYLGGNAWAGKIAAAAAEWAVGKGIDYLCN
jgi:hypothetical protein